MKLLTNLENPLWGTLLTSLFSSSADCISHWMLKISACALCTDKKEKKISFKYKEIQKGSGAKSYTWGRTSNLIWAYIYPYSIWGSRVSHIWWYDFAPNPLQILLTLCRWHVSSGRRLSVHGWAFSGSKSPFGILWKGWSNFDNN